MKRQSEYHPPVARGDQEQKEIQTSESNISGLRKQGTTDGRAQSKPGESGGICVVIGGRDT